MSAGFPLLVVPFIRDDLSGKRSLRQLALQLRRRGLKVRVLRAPGDTPVEECDVLMVSCNNRKVDFLVKELERLWTLSWNRWYAHAKEERHA